MNRSERKKLAHRRAIIDTTVELVDAKGLKNVTMEQIAEKADIARATLYNYFSSKEAIIHEYVQASLAVQNEQHIVAMNALADTASRVRYLLETLTNRVENRREIFESFLTHQMQQMAGLDSDVKPSGVTTPIDEIIRLGTKAGEIRTDLGNQYIRELFLFIFIQLVKHHTIINPTVTPDESIDKSVKLFIRTIKPD